jgi:hypothetical protein
MAERLAFPDDTFLGLIIGFQVGRGQPDLDALSNMLHRIGEDNFRVIVVLVRKKVRIVALRQ